MKVCNFSKSDWANFQFDNAEALKSVGIEAASYTILPHPFKYQKTSELISISNVQRKMLEADFVQIFHSDTDALNVFLSSHSKAKLIVYHAGSRYRRDPATYNKIFNGLVHKSVIALPEFAGLGCHNEQYLVGAIDTDRIYANPSHPQIPFDFRHYPSNPDVKGSMKIVDMVMEVKKKHNLTFRYSLNKQPMADQYERMRECDIYIELFAPLNEGKPYGSFGITALEAASMGKIVVTQNLNSDVYFNEYGFNRLLCADNEEHFKEIIVTLANSTSKEISNLQDETREWVVKNHSYKATGQRIVEKILN